MGVGNKTTRQGNPHLAGAVCDVNLIYIERDSLILLNCKRGGVSSIESYCVLYSFMKYYNKWYPADLDEGALSLPGRRVQAWCVSWLE